MKIVPYYRIRLKGPNKADVPDTIPAPQKASVREYAKENDAEYVESFTEVEDGPMEDRPKLRAAVKKAQREEAQLIIPDHYRVAHDHLFLTILHESGVDFVCLGDSRVQKNFLPMLLKLEEISRTETRIRTKNILAERKAQGVKLGSARPDHWKGREHLRGSKQGAKASAKVRSDRTRAAYAQVILPKIMKMRNKGKTDEFIAAKLNEDGHTTTAGKPFTFVAVYRIRTRYGEEAA
jgi:DNA invertase Pin-like site-specific DNA recombinase